MARHFRRRTSPSAGLIPLIAALPLAAAATWVAYSRLAIDHDRALPPPVPGKRLAIGGAGRLALHSAGSDEGRPLLLLHSVNAAASAFEVRPLYEHYATMQPVYALDLPGFGFSSREKRSYTPRLMVDAIHATVAAIRGRHGGKPVDAVGLSLTCEFLARAALERPEDYRSLGLISPTGFDRVLSGEGRAQTNRRNPVAAALLSVPWIGGPLFDLFVSKPSMRKFLERTWGSRDIDEALFHYDQLTSHQPGARNAVMAFIAGSLFPDDATRVYKLLALPIWTCHGTRGAFTDFSREAEIAGRPNWHFASYDTGAFPHFERLADVVRDYDVFASTLPS